MDTAGGLVVPNIKHVSALSVAGIASRLAHLQVLSLAATLPTSSAGCF